ncbi:MAG: NUDIX domain-containing protein [Halobacteria archaeon]|nr:NUDIX domain-containing protein [Halobacteria archaeon]
MPELSESHVVTCFLRNKGEVLLLRRSDEVGSYSGKWGAVSGYAEGDPDSAALREIEEETGLKDAVALVRRGEPFTVEDESLDKKWVVHPYLFDCNRRGVNVNWETTQADWVPPTEILKRRTVPDLWKSYERIGPTVDSIRNDNEHGSAYISVRALEVLRDKAGVLANKRQVNGDTWDELKKTAKELLEARPAMSALTNRVNRAMYRSKKIDSIDEKIHEEIRNAVKADEKAAERASRVIPGKRVLTLSRSGTVHGSITKASPNPEVVVAESRPAQEGVKVAEELSSEGVEVTLITDAAIPYALSHLDVEAVIVGADTVLPDGSVVNKTGTKSTGLASEHEGIPMYVVAAKDKISTETHPSLEEGDPSDVYDGDEELNIENPKFDVTPPEFITRVVTEDAELRTSDIGEIVEELRNYANW